MITKSREALTWDRRWFDQWMVQFEVQNSISRTCCLVWAVSYVNLVMRWNKQGCVIDETHVNNRTQEEVQLGGQRNWGCCVARQNEALGKR